MSHIACQPSLFLPHGAPDLPLSGHPAAEFLSGLSLNLPKPDGIIIVSAHWESRGLELTCAQELETIYDFMGFSPELYQLRYPATSNQNLNTRVRSKLEENGYKVTDNPQKGLDHGAWAPLYLTFPKADIPIIQLSIDRGLKPIELFELGRTLAPLRKQNILIIGSGSITHNLRALAPEGTAPKNWAVNFVRWVKQTLSTPDWAGLCNYREATEYAQIAHPTPEHFLPLIFAAGAGGPQTEVQQLHHSYSYGSISMDAWSFHDEKIKISAN